MKRLSSLPLSGSNAAGRTSPAADMSNVIAVLPVAGGGATWAHLPVGVDSHIMQGYLDRAIP